MWYSGAWNQQQIQVTGETGAAGVSHTRRTWGQRCMAGLSSCSGWCKIHPSGLWPRRPNVCSSISDGLGLPGSSNFMIQKTGLEESFLKYPLNSTSTAFSSWIYPKGQRPRIASTVWMQVLSSAGLAAEYTGSQITRSRLTHPAERAVLCVLWDPAKFQMLQSEI